MKRLSRQFEEWGTALTAEPFRWARIKLTLVYLGIIAAIVLVFSSSLYSVHSYNVERIEHHRRADLAAPLEIRPSLNDYVQDLGRAIIIGDIITIIVAGSLSYVLAGRTLTPIKDSIEAEQQFFANAAHDLRTPLAVMRTEAEVALRGDDLSTEEARGVIESSLEEIGRMSIMVEQMMSLVRPRTQHRPAKAEMVTLDLSDLAQSVARKMKTRATSEGVRLEITTEGQTYIRGNSSNIERALFNIVENALNYTHAGGSIFVRTRRTGNHVELAVSDTGIGIAPGDLPHITEPFYRGDRARTTHAGGAGLGLTIARTTMTEHRGSLLAQSEPGSGTTITLRFPAA
ncbi:MAG TPA: HAMP domain-containing sensor histidine kinase [Spirochaetia bacterium]|nr:HAMP domain-containing sensor histidine kinase [Spirochaetia bacterium]